MEELLKQIILKWAGVIQGKINARYGNMSAIPGNAHLNVSTPEVIAGGIMVQLFTGDFKAFIAEYGSGSLLDKSNPYLEAYKGSDMWNKEREHEQNGFLGRQAGETVFSPDGTSYESTGKMRGMHLEWGIKASKHRFKALPPYKPFEPQHVIQEEINMILPLIKEDIVSQVKSYLLENIFVVSKTIVI